MARKYTFKAVYAASSMPSHIQRKYIDEEGRRVIQIIGVCNSTNIDNNQMVDDIVAGLILLEQSRENNQ